MDNMEILDKERAKFDLASSRARQEWDHERAQLALKAAEAASEIEILRKQLEDTVNTAKKVNCPEARALLIEFIS